jgi:hypothetical protein
MQHLADLLAMIPLPALEEGAAPSLSRLPSDPLRSDPCRLGCDADLVQDLGADLPAGHLHVWGGPAGAGKTSFLLSLLHAAASRGRRVAYATYDLAPESLAMRMLAMAAAVDIEALPDPTGSARGAGAPPPACAREDCALDDDALRRVHASRAALSRLPFSFLPARGFSVESIYDRLVRMPFRAEVLAVDYLQGVIRAPGTDMGEALRGLSDLADHLHVAVVCAVRPQAGVGAPPSLGGETISRADVIGASKIPDRVGWLGPMPVEAGGAGESRAASDPGTEANATRVSGASSAIVTSEGGSLTIGGPRRAAVVHNRHGARSVLPLELDEATGALEHAGE